MASMQDYLRNDLSALFNYDMNSQAKYAGNQYTVKINDPQRTEADAYGGPEAIELMEIHFQTSDLPKIKNGVPLEVQIPDGTWKRKIIVSSILSADGVELIVTVRAA
jgi:hypothetical protein